MRSSSGLRGVAVSSDVLEDIAELTGRHPGLFGLCYLQMENTLIDGGGRTHESLDLVWQRIRRGLLSGKLGQYMTMKKMAADLNNNNPQAIAARDLLSLLLTASEPFTIRADEKSAAALLARIGVLRLSSDQEWKMGRADHTRFQFASPLVRVLAERLVFQRTSRPSVSVPRVLDADGRLSLDVLSALRLTLSALNRKDLQRILAEDRNTKEIDGGVKAWHEFPLQFRLTSVLENWLPNYVALDYEVVAKQARSFKRVDIVMQHQHQRVLVDLLSSASGQDMGVHINNMDEYADRLGGITEAWLLNVTLRGYVPAVRVPYRDYRLRALHAIVDRDFRRADFVVDMPGEPLRRLQSDLTWAEFDGQSALDHSVGVDL